MKYFALPLLALILTLFANKSHGQDVDDFPPSNNVKKILIRITDVKNNAYVFPRKFFLPDQKPVTKYVIEKPKAVIKFMFSLNYNAKGRFSYRVSKKNRGVFGTPDGTYDSQIFGIIEIHTKTKCFEVLITQQGLNLGRTQKYSNLLYSWLIAKTINDALKTNGDGLTQAGFNRLAGMEVAVAEQFALLKDSTTDKDYEKYSNRPANVWSVFEGIRKKK